MAVTRINFIKSLIPRTTPDLTDENFGRSGLLSTAASLPDGSERRR